MLDIKCKVHMNVLVSISCMCMLVIVLENLALFHEVHLKLGCVSQEGVAVLFVKVHCVNMVLWNLHAALKLESTEVLPNFGFVDFCEDLAVLLCQAFEMFSAVQS